MRLTRNSSVVDLAPAHLQDLFLVLEVCLQLSQEVAIRHGLGQQSLVYGRNKRVHGGNARSMLIVDRFVTS